MQHNDEREISRRNFMQTVGLAGLGLAVGSIATAQDAATTATAGRGNRGGRRNAPADANTTATAEAKFAKPAEGAVLEKRKYGKTGLELPILTMGCMFNVLDNPMILKKALSLGLTTWDTAASYVNGKSEEGIGKYFETYPEDRKKVHLSTKIGGPYTPAEMEKILTRSLERMKTDYIDQIFLHGGGPKDFTPEVKAWVEQKKKEGKIKFFGASFHVEMAQRLVDFSKIDWCEVIMVTCNYRMLKEEDQVFAKAIEAASKSGIAIMAMKTQGRGPVKADTDAAMKLSAHFMDKGCTEHQASILAVLENPYIHTATSLMPSAALIDMNTAAVTQLPKLTVADHSALREYANATKHTYCTGCGACEKATGCAGIRDLMRFSMYESAYGDLALARERFAELPSNVQNALASLSVDKAQRVCPKSLPLAQIFESSLSKLA